MTKSILVAGLGRSLGKPTTVKLCDLSWLLLLLPHPDASHINVLSTGTRLGPPLGRNRLARRNAVSTALSLPAQLFWGDHLSSTMAPHPTLLLTKPTSSAPLVGPVSCVLRQVQYDYPDSTYLTSKGTTGPSWRLQYSPSSPYLRFGTKTDPWGMTSTTMNPPPKKIGPTGRGRIPKRLAFGPSDDAHRYRHGLERPPTQRVEPDPTGGSIDPVER